MRQVAIQRLKRLTELEKSSAKPYFGLGLLYMDEKRLDDASAAYKKSIEVSNVKFTSKNYESVSSIFPLRFRQLTEVLSSIWH